MSIGIDISEPSKMANLVGNLVDTYSATFNIQGFADYVFTDANDQIIQVEKEPSSAILGNMMAIEDEINRHRANAHHTIVMEVGLPVPHKDGTKILPYKDFILPMRYEAYIAWRHELFNNGLEYIQVLNDQAAAMAIVAIYNNCQKTDHHMFKRYLKPQISWHANPSVRTLMGIVGANLGETKALQLIDRFETLYRVVNCAEEDLEALPGWGKKSIDKFMKAIGR